MIDVTKELSGLVLLYYVLEKNIFVMELRENDRCYKRIVWIRSTLLCIRKKYIRYRVTGES